MLPAMPSAGRTPRAEVELVREPGQLRALESEWRDLAVSRGNAFISPEWFLVWHRHYGSEHEPLVGVVRGSEGELQGLLPLVVGRRGRSRTARFAGSGLGDHFHPVAATELESAVAAAVGRAMRAESRPRRALVLENVDADAGWWRELSQASGYGANPLIDRSSTLPSVRLAGQSWDSYLASRSRNLRSQIGRKLRALEREHEVRVRWSSADDSVAADMATLFRLHDMRWAAREGTSSLTGQRARAFHADFAAAARERGWLRLCFLEVDGEPVAGWYGWYVGSRFAYYQAGFDPAWADRSVGFVLFTQTIRAAADEGASEYDMLLGEEGFKGRFADSARPVCTVVVAPRLHPSRLLAGPERGLRRAGRRLPDSVSEPVKQGARSLLKRLPMARRR
jgi:CelD/BcsL family acetyltransferase involved in cellulose biosynthesis